MLRSSRTYSPVERRRRAAARLALYASTIFVALAAWAGARLLVLSVLRGREQAWSHVKYAAMREVDLLARYVRIDTSAESGSEVAGVRFLEEQLRQAGISSTVDLVDEKHANLWAVIEGTMPEALVLHHHIDVSAADATQWAYPPFAGDIEGPWIRGRGTFDMKSVAIAQLLAMSDVRSSGTRPKHSLIFLATGDEEHGSTTGMQRILASQPDLVRRFGVVLTEGGALEARSLEDLKYWGIEVAQRRYAELLIRAPTRERLDSLRSVITARVPVTSDRRLCRETATFLAAYAGSRDLREYRLSLARPERLLLSAEAFEAAPPMVRELLVDDMFVGPTAADPSDGFQMKIGFLLLPDSDWESVLRERLPPSATVGVEITGGVAHGPSPGSPLDHPVFQCLRQALESEFPGVPTGPYMLGHTLTDARFLRARGVVAYGFSPFPILSADAYHADKPNEELGLPGYVSGVAVYRALVQRVIGQDSPWK